MTLCWTKGQITNPFMVQMQNCGANWLLPSSFSSVFCWIRIDFPRFLQLQHFSLDTRPGYAKMAQEDVVDRNGE